MAIMAEEFYSVNASITLTLLGTVLGLTAPSVAFDGNDGVLSLFDGTTHGAAGVIGAKRQ